MEGKVARKTEIAMGIALKVTWKEWYENGEKEQEINGTGDCP